MVSLSDARDIRHRGVDNKRRNEFLDKRSRRNFHLHNKAIFILALGVNSKRALSGLTKVLRTRISEEKPPS